LLFGFQLVCGGLEGFKLGDHVDEFCSEPGAVGFEVRDNTRIDELALVAFE
jgi:hypothetical protein